MTVMHDFLAWVAGAPTFARGIHPHTCKDRTAGSPIEVMPNPQAVVVPLHQHAGASATVSIRPGQEVVVGELIGRAAEGALSANIHASLAGKVQPVTTVTLPNGRRSLAVAIKRGAEASNPASLWNELSCGEWPAVTLSQHSSEEITSAVRDAGVVGLGGAAFPTHRKLAQSSDRLIHTVLLNGCECEPYLTADDRLMIETPGPILAGLRLAMRASGATRAKIAIEDNKSHAIESMIAAVKGLADIEVAVVQTKYPMGGERQLIPAVFGREVPTNGYPLDIGILVMNVSTAAAVANAVLHGNKLTHRVICVSGGGIRVAKNLFVPIGVSMSDVIDHCGGLTPDARRVIAGGPMMGFTVTDLAVPITKATSGITVLAASELDECAETTCIRCGRCIDVCPLGLMPTKIAHAVKFENRQQAESYDISACCECGCCAYVCPSRIPLVQYIRMGKRQWPR